MVEKQIIRQELPKKNRDDNASYQHNGKYLQIILL